MKNKKNTSNNVSYPLRILAGFYLLYLAYSLVKDWQRIDNKVFFAIFIAIFSIIGILLLINSAMGLLHNKNSQDLNQDDRVAGGSIQNSGDNEHKVESTGNASELEPKEADIDAKADREE